MASWQPRTPNDVLDVLAVGDRDDALIGVYETTWLDFKGQYHFESPRDHWRFASDVAAMATSGGGVIVVGIQTKKDPDVDEDRASKIEPMPHERFDTKRAHDIIERDVYPMPEGLEIRPYLRGDKRLVAIVIPQQDVDRGPFLVTKYVDDESGQWHAISAPSRSGSRTVHEKAGMLHGDITDGRRWRRSGSTVPTTPEGSPQAPRDEARPIEPGDPPVADQEHLIHAEAWVEAAASTMERQLDLHDIAALYLAAVPTAQRRRPADFFAAEGLRLEMSTRRAFRRAGFGITYGHNVRVGASSLLSVDEGRTFLRVDVDGHVVGAALGSPDMLGWAQDQTQEVVGARRALRINVVALSEYVYEFCRFIEREIAARWGRVGWALAAHVRHAQGATRPLALPEGWRPHQGDWFDSHAAEADTRSEAFAAELDAARDAAMILEFVYGLFGMSIERNPFVVDGRFDQDKLTAIT